jgi:YhcH/YjgK/YiaL family protein
MKKIILLSAIFFSFLMHVQAQTGAVNEGNKKQAKKWFHKKQWLGGLPLRPHQSIDVQEFYRQYTVNKPYWDKAFAFLKEHQLETLSKGRYEIDGDNVYASVTESPSRNFDSTQWESHRKYIDIQYVIDGKELIGVYPVSKATPTRSYDEHKDVANYSADGKLYKATPGTFFIFFPTDAHRPNITPGGNKRVKKMVIKIKAVN